MNNYTTRLLKLLLGTSLFALGIVINMKANLGFAPWEVFHSGIGNAAGMTIGSVSIITSLLICVIVVFMGEKLGFGTIINMILIGILIDLLLRLNFIPQADGLISGVVTMLVGLFIILVAIKRKTKLPVGLCRWILEISVVLFGWVLGGPVGIGTVIASFGIGFCIQTVFSLMKFEPTAVQHETLDMTRKSLKKLFIS